MDIQRYLLIAAAAVLSFMLLTEWNVFKDQRVAATQDTSPRIANSFSSPAASPQEQPTGIANRSDIYDTAANSDDVPTILPALAPQPNTPLGTSEPKNIIVIKNDVLEFVVDLRGGDIIETSLTKYPERIEDPDTPLVLLERSSERTYIM